MTDTISKQDALSIMNNSQVDGSEVCMDIEDHDAIQRYIENAVSWETYKALLDESNALKQKYSALTDRYETLKRATGMSRMYSMGYSDGYAVALNVKAKSS